MKKLILFLASFLVCGSVLADNILLINTDAESKQMVVSYKICKGTPMQPTCGNVQTVTLMGKYVQDTEVFKRIPIAANEFVIITSITSSRIHLLPQDVTFSFSEKNSECYGTDKDVIRLTSDGTDTMICDNRGRAGVINTKG